MFRKHTIKNKCLIFDKERCFKKAFLQNIQSVQKYITYQQILHQKKGKVSFQVLTNWRYYDTDDFNATAGRSRVFFLRRQPTSWGGSHTADALKPGQVVESMLALAESVSH